MRSGFSIVPLRRIARVQNGGTPGPHESNWEGDVPWATPVDLGRVHGGYLQATERSITATGLQSGSTLVPAGSVLISSRAPIGYAAIAGMDTAFNQGCKALIPLPGVSQPRFLKYAVESQMSTLQAAGRGSTFTEVSASDVASLPVPVTSLAKQDRIADYLDRETAEIDAFTSDQQTFRHLLIERWVSGLVNLVQPQLLEPDSVEADQLRPLWTRTRLKSTVESEKNGSWGAEEDVDQVTRRCIRVADFDKHSGRIHSRSETNRSYPADQASSLALEAGDLLIEKSGGGPTSPVGNVVLYTGPGGDLFSNFVARIRLRADIDPRFALYLHRALYLSGVTNRSIKQTTGIQNLDSSSYFNETVWLPSPEDQRVLGQRVEAQRDFIDETLKDVDLSITLAEERRAALITAAVTGQIDVTKQGVSAAEQLRDELGVQV